MTTTSTDTAVRFFVALGAARGADGIFGIGHTAETAIADAHEGSQTRPGEAAFQPEPATERLYVHVERFGCDANNPGYRWSKNAAGLLDLDLGDDEVALDDAVDEVLTGFRASPTRLRTSGPPRPP